VSKLLEWIKWVPARTWFSLAGVSAFCVWYSYLNLDLPDLSKIDPDVEAKLAATRNRA
jgi:hypothetical protein